MSADVAKAAAIFYQPQDAIRFRWNRNTDTPLPPDTPAGKNPPDGAILDTTWPKGRASPLRWKFSMR